MTLVQRCRIASICICKWRCCVVGTTLSHRIVFESTAQLPNSIQFRRVVLSTTLQAVWLSYRRCITEFYLVSSMLVQRGNDFCLSSTVCTLSSFLAVLVKIVEACDCCIIGSIPFSNAHSDDHRGPMMTFWSTTYYLVSALINRFSTVIHDSESRARSAANKSRFNRRSGRMLPPVLPDFFFTFFAGGFKLCRNVLTGLYRLLSGWNAVISWLWLIRLDSIRLNNNEIRVCTRPAVRNRLLIDVVFLD